MNKIMKKELKSLVLGMVISGASVGVMASTDGATGGTSTGDFDLRLIINGQVRVWGFQDLAFTTATGGESGTQDICFYSTSERVSLTIAATNNAFRLGDPNSPSVYMPYTVGVKGINAGEGVIPGGQNAGNHNTTITWGESGADNVSGGTHTDPFVAQNTEATTCASHENIQVAVTFASTPVGGALPTGVYTDTVTLEVAPM